MDVVGNDQLHHQDRVQYPVDDLRGTEDGGEGAELVEEEARQV